VFAQQPLGCCPAALRNNQEWPRHWRHRPPLQLSAREGVAGDVADVSAGTMFSSTAALTNADVINLGLGLPRTAETVADVAGRAGIDLSNSTVRIIDDPEYIRYLDSQGACACAPYDLPGEMHLGPASFLNDETLAATLAHEQEHLLQYAAGWISETGTRLLTEEQAQAAETCFLERLLGSGQ